jgi:hypothetical protein
MHETKRKYYDLNIQILPYNEILFSDKMDEISSHA